MLTDLQTQLRELSKESRTNGAVFEALGQRMRARNVTNLRLLKYFLMRQGVQIASDQYMEVFRKLEDMGVGTLIRGRKTKSGQTTPARFAWNYNLKDVARIATGTVDPIRKIEPKMKEVIKEDLEPEIENGSDVVKAKNNNISINRNGIKINIDLPKDIRPEELAAWLTLVREFQK